MFSAVGWLPVPLGHRERAAGFAGRPGGLPRTPEATIPRRRRMLRRPSGCARRNRSPPCRRCSCPAAQAADAVRGSPADRGAGIRTPRGDTRCPRARRPRTRQPSCLRRPGPANLREDHAVLEGSRFPLVGVADHVVGVPPGLAAVVPFHPGGESRAAPSPQLRGGDLGDDLFGAPVDRGPDGVAPFKGSKDHGAGASKVRFDPAARHAVSLAYAGHDPGNIRGLYGRHDTAVDQCGGRLVAHPDAGDELQADHPVGRGFPEPAPGGFLERLRHLGHAVQLLDDGLASRTVVRPRGDREKK